MRKKYCQPILEIESLVTDNVVALSLLEEGIGEEGDEEY